ncbi:hypothetical protein KUTeg_004217 [Tegillarca granosa]|uniref:tRNA wybutosine-synthesizing protein 3 homolog n=1 Tax=Tegillarca granosa TaxID=220873 RepID=A0ABQ9FQX7_TEGGR|nr:hypothetical protein KUTeg_004217 [Tegillarca granosa]
MDVFVKQKANALNGVDLSRKGSVDAPIQPLIEYINNESDYFTTSSCSGRIIVFDDVKPTDPSSKGDHDIYVKKKGCKWLFTSHDMVAHQEVVSSLDDVTGDAVFKFEPFVLHVQCKSLQRAQQMLGIAVASGFRNSGISIGNKGKILVAVRSTHTMEVPLTQNGNLLVTKEIFCDIKK